MYLRAISLGYAVPDGNFAASVHSVFQSSINLRPDGEIHLLTLLAAGEGDLPQGIRLEAPEGFSFEDLRVGDWAICREGLLVFEKNSLTVQLSGARRWKCDLPAAGRTGSPIYLSNWSFVWRVLNERQRQSEAEIVAEELFRPGSFPQASVRRRAGEVVQALVHAARRSDTMNTAVVRALIGLGSGLTPSGDDLLIGYLAGLWCTAQARNERMKFISSLGKTITQFASKTNDISHTYLYHAAQGQVSSRLADLVEAISQEEAPERLRGIAEAAMSIGHTSGMDAVTGLLIGLAAWTRAGASDLFI